MMQKPFLTPELASEVLSLLGEVGSEWKRRRCKVQMLKPEQAEAICIGGCDYWVMGDQGPYCSAHAAGFDCQGQAELAQLEAASDELPPDPMEEQAKNERLHGNREAQDAEYEREAYR